MIRRLIACILLSISCGFSINGHALATLTGLWWNANESGWGVSLDHQASFVFAAFYIYDETGNPFWVVSELTAASATSTLFTGPVYTATGSPFSQLPFKASETKGRALGDETLSIDDPSHARLSYTVKGVRIDKTIQRQTTKPISLNGTFQNGSDSTYRVNTFILAGGVVSVAISADISGQGTCQYEGTPTQIGSRFVILGTYRCSNLTDGTWRTDDFTLHDDGATMSATVSRISKGTAQVVTARWMAMKSSGSNFVGSVSTLPKVPVASLSGLWWNPGESGWGVALDQQSAFVFASFYIYDQNGSPFWVVSELSASSPTVFAGPVHNATGTPFFRLPFLASDTKSIALGTARLTVDDSNHAVLTYTLNGTQVVKQIQRQTTKPLGIVGTYIGGSTPAALGVDSRTFKITSEGSLLAFDITSFLESPCKYLGSAINSGARLAISGTFRCGLSDGVWSTDDLTIVDGDLLIATIKQARVGQNPVVAERWFGRKTQ